MNPLLFSKGDLHAAIEGQGERLAEAVSSIPEEHFVQADVDELVNWLATEFRIVCPTLHVADRYRDDVQEVQVDVSGDPRRAFSAFTTDRRILGYRLAIHVPFTGDKAVFELRPSTFTTFNPPVGKASDQDLVFTLEYPHDTTPDIDTEVNSLIGKVENWLTYARNDIEEFNKTLETTARGAIAARRARIEARDSHLAASAIPVRRKASEKTYIPDSIIRRPAPLSRVRKDVPQITMEPILPEQVFEHILSVIRMQAAEMERAPKTYASLDEEARRDLFLATLNTHYEGRGSAEAFNKGGKTDILIRYESKNLLVCECKFWTGSKAFVDAIDQLFRYTAWRDTKLAMIIFVREKGLTEIVAKAKEALAGHAQFAQLGTPASESELRATVTLPGDDQRTADLNIFFVHTPE